MAGKILQKTMREHARVRDAYIDALRGRGISFAAPGSSDERIAELRGQLVERGATFRNAGASIVHGWMSQACVECTGNSGSETFSTTFKCHRDCYFCFNRNQADYDYFFEHGCPWEQTLADSKRVNGSIACVGLTGGEPLIDIDETIRFLETARETFPGAHMRMYTSGDLLDEDKARRLAEAGLREIRFSVKNDDRPEMQERVLAAMRLATEYIDDVMVEMPIVPGTGDEMRELMRAFAAAGIDGMNLLEFCFPFARWEDFADRGFEVRNPPFDVMYDYSYSGGLPIAGSEELALELMLFAIDEELGFGLHYCSLDNKHRSEMRQINEPAAHLNPCFTFDDGDFFLKCAKVYGNDRAAADDFLRSMGYPHAIRDDAGQSLAFPVRFARMVAGTGAEVAISTNVLEKRDGAKYIRELSVEPL
ncbi:MAG: radical SAM protein [Coriobacteriales bacterium]|jgi:pyruvate formate-lyase activating enzyme-like uncharacterized protein